MTNCNNCGLFKECDEHLHNYFWEKEDNDCPYYKEKKDKEKADENS